MSLTWSTYFSCHSSKFFLILAFSLQTGFTGQIPFSNTSPQWENIPIWPHTMFIILWNILRPTSSLRVIKWLILLKKGIKIIHWFNKSFVLFGPVKVKESWKAWAKVLSSFIVDSIFFFRIYLEYDVYSTMCKHSLTAFEVQLISCITIKHKLFLLILNKIYCSKDVWKIFRTNIGLEYIQLSL